MTSAAGVAKELLSRRVERLDRAALVDRDDPIDGGLNDGAESDLTLLQCCLAPLAPQPQDGGDPDEAECEGPVDQYHPQDRVPRRREKETKNGQARTDERRCIREPSPWGAQRDKDDQYI